MLNLDNKNRYVIACSFGPDSMALLDMAIKDKLSVIVAHVNYHKRDVSNDEEAQLRKFCEERNVPIEVLDTSNLKCEKNFQGWAREVRYNFFKKVLKKYDAQAVLVAHQQDDLIETYLMQKNRSNIVKYQGIAEKTHIFDVDIIRPLLSKTKQELLDYDIQNNVPFSIDESNLTNNYTRNKIRHEIVEKMSNEERQKILLEISELKSETLVKDMMISVDDFNLLSDKQLTFWISDFVDQKQEHKDISKSFIDEIRKAVNSNKTFVEISLSESLVLTKDYQKVFLIDKNETISYKYVLEKGQVIDDDLFLINFKFKNGQSERNISDKDYPLTIKPVTKNEFIKIKDYECEVRRLFIDWKMPHHLRECWPGVYNSKGKLIYIPRYREKFVDNHNSKLIIKFSK